MPRRRRRRLIARWQQRWGKRKRFPALPRPTGDYSVYQNTPDGSTKPVYQASQSLQLVMDAPGGAPPAGFTALVGQLQQEGLLLNSLDGDLSATRRRKRPSKAPLMTRYGRSRRRLRRWPGYWASMSAKFKRLNVNVNMPGPVMMAAPKMMMMAAAAPPPQAAPAQVTGAGQCECDDRAYAASLIPAAPSWPVFSVCKSAEHRGGGVFPTWRPKIFGDLCLQLPHPFRVFDQAEDHP